MFFELSTAPPIHSTGCTSEYSTCVELLVIKQERVPYQDSVDVHVIDSDICSLILMPLSNGLKRRSCPVLLFLNCTLSKILKTDVFQDCKLKDSVTVKM